MSYTKSTYKKALLEPINKIQEETLGDNDYTNILSYLNSFMEVHEKITSKGLVSVELWNEIISDVISSIHSATSGFYRLSIIALRSVLELSCSSIYYFDHEVEYKLFQQHDLKADKYVNTLVNDHMFFNSKYIHTFYENINQEQSSADSVSSYLKTLYGELSDIVHGRYKQLTKIDGLEIKYNKELFKHYEKKLFQTLSVITLMYVLRLNDKDKSLLKFANYCKAVRL